MHGTMSKKKRLWTSLRIPCITQKQVKDFDDIWYEYHAIECYFT